MDRLSQNQIQNYTLISKVGEGASAQVILAKQNQTKSLCVLKMILKSSLQHQDDQKRVLQQKQALEDLHHPFLVKMLQAFQTRKHFCLALQYCPGGDLYTHLHMSQTFTEEQISLYASQLVLAIEYLHENNIIFRDLKPENILIDKEGYLKLTDFGMSKSRIMCDDSRTYSICGTSQYTAPEMLQKQGHGKAFDWWTLGCCLYEMVYKTSPFYSDDRTQMFEKILNDEPTFNEEISHSLMDLIRTLLCKNPQKRMKFAKDIKNHPFFSGIDFQMVYLKQYQAPYIPECARGKRMIKVIKDEVQAFTEFEDCESSEAAYMDRFDYNCGYQEQSTSEAQNEQQSKLTERESTQDDEEDKNSQQSKDCFSSDDNRSKIMSKTF